MIPSFLGNISTLKQFNFAYNSFAPNQIPPELGNLTHLEIPDLLGRLWSLLNLDLAMNNLHDPIPKSITNLSSVVQIELYNNFLSGGLPAERRKEFHLKL
ncbi:hypothetical protein NE237_012101 [Protea cynaroides]|uniref:Uncharacterized protein n=1 Tax=Protea cynaroides TaxID=273540 RepID=A0A9Q0GWW1_9MAGN|nr:hypothetical protein NE237_012101 [Protea cynaroides]